MRKKILIVDDEYTIRELIDLTLNQEYDIIKAENGMKALELIKEKPDLVILDIMMPGMDGYQVCRKIKENEETKNIPVIMLSAKHEIEDLKQAIKVDVDEYITKPFEPDMLKKRVDENVYHTRKNAERKLFRYGKSLHYIRDNMQNNKVLS